MVLKGPRGGLELKFYELCLPVIEKENYKLYDLDYLVGNHTLRVFIEDPETNTAELSDCVKIDKALSPLFEEHAWIPNTVTLEVSSPGIYRSLNSVEHFESVVGEDVSLSLKKKFSEFFADDEAKISELPRKLKNERKIIASLKSVESDGVLVSVRDSIELNIKFEDIKKANLEADINF